MINDNNNAIPQFFKIIIKNQKRIITADELLNILNDSNDIGNDFRSDIEVEEINLSSAPSEDDDES